MTLIIQLIRVIFFYPAKGSCESGIWVKSLKKSVKWLFFRWIH